MKNRRQQLEEEEILQTFRRVWAGAPGIASAEIGDAPDVRGVLFGGRRFGMEIVTLTNNARAQSDAALSGSFTSELRAACATAGIHGSFSLSLGDWQAGGLVDKARRAHVVALLVQLARDAGARPLHLGERAMERRGIGDLGGLTFTPDSEGFEVYFGQHSWSVRGSEFVRERIAQKDERAADYRAAIGDADLWLLLVAGTKLASSVVRSPPTETFETRFDRVFFCQGEQRTGGETAAHCVGMAR